MFHGLAIFIVEHFGKLLFLFIYFFLLGFVKTNFFYIHQLGKFQSNVGLLGQSALKQFQLNKHFHGYFFIGWEERQHSGGHHSGHQNNSPIRV